MTNKGTFVENAVWSDLDPLAAPNWTVTVEWSRDDHFMDTPLSNSIRRLLEASRDAQALVALNDVLGGAKESNSNANTGGGSDDSSDSKRGGSSSSGGGGAKSPTNEAGFVRSLRAHIETATLTATHGKA
jgi:hypothetical protein